MSAASVSLISPPIGSPLSIPDDGMMSLGILANKLGGNPEEIGARFERAGLAVDRTGRGWGWVLKADLPVIFGEARARSLLYGLQSELVNGGVAGHILGVFGGEAIALCERRGVAVQRTTVHPLASRTGCVYLRRILDYERTYVVEADDWIDARVALPRIRSAQSTVISGGAPEWLEEGVDFADGNGPTVNPYAEAVARCRWSSIRCSKVSTSRRTVAGPLKVPRFDCYRLLGIDLGGELDTYKAWISEAHAAILGIAGPAAARPSAGVELETKAVGP